MKKIIFSLFALFTVSAVCAIGQTIQLLSPNLARPATLMQSLASRASVRSFSAEALSLADLSDLLWAANGVNRTESGKRTAASAMDRREVDIYVLMEKGAYLFDADKNVLTLVCDKDLRALTAGRQTSVAEAPVTLLLVSNAEKFRMPETAESHDRNLTMRGVDVGIVSANISLYCSATGLATVPRGSMETSELVKALNLKEGHLPMLNHPVGHPKQ